MHSASLKLIVTPLKSALLKNHSNKLHVLIRIQAPSAPEGYATNRRQQRISFVIDRSGSMHGYPLEEAIRCVKNMSDEMHVQDQAALITFDNNVKINCPISNISDHAKINHALLGVHSGGSTNLHGGWHAGAVELMSNLDKDALNHVILLSDGCANVGITDLEQIKTEAAKFADQGVSTSTYGLGRNFNEDLMVELAKAGRGSHYYAESADDLMSSFRQEFDLIANLWSESLNLKVKTEKDVRINMLNSYVLTNEVLHKNGKYTFTWRMPNVAFESEAWALIEVVIPKNLTQKSGKKILSVSIESSNVFGESFNITESLEGLDTLEANAYGAVGEDELVSRRVKEIAASKLLEKSREAARNCNWEEVKSLLEEANLQFKDNPWVKVVIQSMEKLAASKDAQVFTKEAIYSSLRMSSRLASQNESALYSRIVEDHLPSFLRRKAEQGKA